jgi:hypothetical protein
VVGVLTAPSLQIAGKGCHEDDPVLLHVQQLVAHFPEQVELHPLVDDLQLTVNMVRAVSTSTRRDQTSLLCLHPEDAAVKHLDHNNCVLLDLQLGQAFQNLPSMH